MLLKKIMETINDYSKALAKGVSDYSAFLK